MFKNGLLKIALISISCLLSYQLFSQEIVSRSLNALYTYDFIKARQTIDQLPSGKAKSLLKIYLWRTQNKPIHAFLVKEADLYYQLMQDFKTASIDDYCSGQTYRFLEALLFAEYHYQNNRLIEALKHGFKAIEIYNEKEKNSVNNENDFFYFKSLVDGYLSIYQNRLAELPIAGNFFSDESLNNSVKELVSIAEQNTIFSIEAQKQLASLYLRHQHNYEQSFLISKKLVNTFPENLKMKEVYIESMMILGYFNRELVEQIKWLEDSDDVYYQKYGMVYRTMFHAESNMMSLSAIENEAISTFGFINQNGGGNHLRSILNACLYRRTGKKEYAKEVKNRKVYDYALTELDNYK